MANSSMSSILGFVPGSPSAKTSSKSSSKKPTPKKPATKKPATKSAPEKPAPKPTPKSEPAPKSAPERPTPVKPAETKPAEASTPAPKSEPDKSSPKSTVTNLTDNLRTIYDFSEDSKVKIGTMRFGTLMQLVNDFVIPLIIYNKIFRDKMRAVIKRADELGADRPAS